MDVLGSLGKRILKTNRVSIDNAVFKLHYRVSVVLFAAFSLLVTSTQYIGDPIDCLSSSSAIPSQIMDQYCWISTTFTMVINPKLRVGIDIPHPGLESSSDTENSEGLIYHQYYQWVCFVLFLQAAMFYVPHYLWKIWEGGRIQSLTEVSAAKDGNHDAVVTYFTVNFRRHNFYFARYVICEFLNLFNVIGQIFFINRFLGGAFLNYGVDVIEHTESADQYSRVDPMVKVFPRVTKCIFNTYGASGDVQKHDALCILPINIINEKIYIFLWFYLIILSVLSGLAVIYRLLTIVVTRMRFLLLKSRSRFVAKEYVDVLISKFQVGDWFVVYQLGKSVDASDFTGIIGALAKTFGAKGDEVKMREMS